jgi:Xaa-Pro aminopeptidase
VSRTERLVAALPGREVDALLVSEPVNLRYLTGFTGSNGLALVSPERRLFLTDFRYLTQAAEQVPGYDRRQASQDLLQGAADAVAEETQGDLRLGFDDRHLTVRQHRRLRDQLPDRVELVAAGGLVEDLRAVKDAGEIAAIRAAAELADQAFAVVFGEGRPVVGRTERELALELETRMRRLGARAPSFPSIVAGGAHAALPHAEPRGEPVEAGTLLVVDWGAELDGYCSDCTRTLATGRLGEREREVYELVLRAQRAALEAVAPGPTGREVDAVARDLIEAAGHGERFGHGLGHGVGMVVHEGPRLSRLAGDTALQAGHVVTVEPGVYLPGEFGVRIEDLVAVGDEGPEVLSGLSKELVTVG